jgi:hypothetical protein
MYLNPHLEEREKRISKDAGLILLPHGLRRRKGGFSRGLAASG